MYLTTQNLSPDDTGLNFKLHSLRPDQDRGVNEGPGGAANERRTQQPSQTVVLQLKYWLAKCGR